MCPYSFNFSVFLNNTSITQYYCLIIRENHLYCKELSSCLVADSYFAKSEVVETITALKMHCISSLRDDAALLYLNRKPKTGKRGAPKKYAGKVITAQSKNSLTTA